MNAMHDIVGGHRLVLFKLAKNRKRVLLPLGEGGPEGRMRANLRQTLTRGFSRGFALSGSRFAAPPSPGGPGGRGTHPYMTAKLKSTPHKRLSREQCNLDKSDEACRTARSQPQRLADIPMKS